MSNPLASYFTNSSDLNSSSDIGGRSFFDVISECKDFSNTNLLIKILFYNQCNIDNLDDRDSSVLLEEDSIYDLWPLPEKLKNLDTNLNDITNEFYFAIQEPLVSLFKEKFFIFDLFFFQNDPIKQLVLKHFGTQEASKRQLPNADSVVCDVNGLQILIVFNQSNFYKLNLFKFIYLIEMWMLQKCS